MPSPSAAQRARASDSPRFARALRISLHFSQSGVHCPYAHGSTGPAHADARARRDARGAARARDAAPRVARAADARAHAGAGPARERCSTIVALSSFVSRRRRQRCCSRQRSLREIDQRLPWRRLERRRRRGQLWRLAGGGGGAQCGARAAAGEPARAARPRLPPPRRRAIRRALRSRRRQQQQHTTLGPIDETQWAGAPHTAFSLSSSWH